jgi:hypothetical protein
VIGQTLRVWREHRFGDALRVGSPTARRASGALPRYRATALPRYRSAARRTPRPMKRPPVATSIRRRAARRARREHAS